MTNLINAPTIAVIDENLNLTVNWAPPLVDSTGAPLTEGFGAYAGWYIGLGVNGGSPTLQSYGAGYVTGEEVGSGGTDSARIFTEQVPVASTYALTMEALSAETGLYSNAGYWTVPLTFPTALTLASVLLSTATPLLGQPVLISLAPAYTEAAAWRVQFPDGSFTDWLPLSVKTIAKAFTTSGAQNLVVQVQNDFSSGTPAVQLRAQVTIPIVVGTQQYTPVSPTAQVTGTLGIGGDAGFEVIGLDTPLPGSALGTALAPYELVVRALVRETTTNELKLLVATSRTASASSLLGTMAVDVFPIVGRPHSTELIKAVLYLDTNAATSIAPVQITTGTTANLVLPAPIIGKTFLEFPMQAIGGTAPYTWYSKGLPNGLKMSIDGTINGTAMQMGSFPVSFAVMDSSSPAFIDSTTLTLTVNSDLEITTETVPGATVGTPYSFQMTSIGGLLPVTWAVVSGAMPGGLSIDPNLGLISGSPVSYNSTTDFSKVYSFTIQVTDSIGAVASKAFTNSLSAAALKFGPVDQPFILANSSYMLTVPIFGGVPPYSLLSFTDDGVVGSGPRVASPDNIMVVAGVAPAALTVTVANPTLFFPSMLPAITPIVLTASGGTAPYTFAVGTPTTLPSAAILGNNLLFGGPASAGAYTVAISVTDASGVQSLNNIVNVIVQEQNTSPWSVEPVSVNLNSSTDPAAWTITPLAALPDAVNGQPYCPAVGSCYGLALYNSGTLHMTQTAGGTSTPMDFVVAGGSLPTGAVLFTNSAFGGTGDHSGIALFNYTGPTFTPTANGSTSFLMEVSNIYTGSAYVDSAARQSITVNTGVVGSPTPVVVVTATAALAVSLAASLGNWAYPLTADGGTGPYTYTLQSGTTLPLAQLSTATGFPEITSTTTATGTYVVNVMAKDSNGVTSAVQPISITITP